MQMEALSGAFWHKPVFFVAVAFVIFVVLFGKRIWSALAAMLDARTAAIKRDLAEAAQLRREAEGMLAEARSQREVALADAKRMLEYAREEAGRVAVTAKADAETAARRRERMAMDRIAAAEQAAIRDVRVAAAEVASAAAEKLIAEGFTGDDDAHLIDRAIAGLPAALVTQRAALRNRAACEVRRIFRLAPTRGPAVR